MVLVTKKGVTREVSEDKVSYWEKRGFEVKVEVKVEVVKPKPKPKQKRTPAPKKED